MYFLVNSPAVFETFWTKNDERITTVERDQNINHPSLIIKNVSPDDAGEYRLTAINAVGSSTSDVIVLGILLIDITILTSQLNLELFRFIWSASVDLNNVFTTLKGAWSNTIFMFLVFTML